MLLFANCFQQVLIGIHPRNGVEEICQRGALGAQGAHRRADGVFASRTAGHIGIRAMEGEVGLVEFANG